MLTANHGRELKTDALIHSDQGCHYMGKFGDTWWVGMQSNPALTGIYNHLVLHLKAAGFPIESRQFKPHLTLAREIRLLEGTAVAQTEGFAAEVRSIHLMKSERINGRLTYTSIHEKSLI